MEVACLLLLSKNLNINLWVEALNTAAFVLNRSRKTPIEIYFGRKFDFKKFKIFGTDVFFHIDKSQRKEVHRIPT